MQCKLGVKLLLDLTYDCATYMLPSLGDIVFPKGCFSYLCTHSCSPLPANAPSTGLINDQLSIILNLPQVLIRLCLVLLFLLFGPKYFLIRFLPHTCVYLSCEQASRGGRCCLRYIRDVFLILGQN